MLNLHETCSSICPKHQLYCRTTLCRQTLRLLLHQCPISRPCCCQRPPPSISLCRCAAIVCLLCWLLSHCLCSVSVSRMFGMDGVLVPSGMLQVFSNVSICCNTEAQSRLLGVTNNLLAEQINLITLRLTNVTTTENAALSDYPFSAAFTFVSSMDVYAPLPSLATVRSGLCRMFHKHCCMPQHTHTPSQHRIVGRIVELLSLCATRASRQVCCAVF